MFYIWQTSKYFTTFTSICAASSEIISLLINFKAGYFICHNKHGVFLVPNAESQGECGSKEKPHVSENTVSHPDGRGLAVMEGELH